MSDRAQEPEAEPTEPEAHEATAEESEGPAPKRADVLRDFRATLANRHQHGGGKRQKPAGGNPRFK